MSAHAKLSPSSSSSWMECPAFPDVQADYINEDNEAAAEGTAAHAISDFCLTHGFDAYDFIGVRTRITGTVAKTIRESSGKLIKTKETEQRTWEFVWTEEDADYLQPGIDWIREQEGTFYGEARVDLSDWLGENQFGTMDRVVLSDKMIVVSDLKFGRGIPVQAVGNKQLRLYALGAWKKYASHITDPDFPVLIHIDQPRNAAGGGMWRITLGELWQFGEEARIAAEATRQPNPPRIAGEKQCLWCAGRDDCEAYNKYNLEMLNLEFDDLDDVEGELALPDPKNFTPERMRVILDHAGMIKKWLDTIHATLFQQVMSEGTAAGLKAVEGRKLPDSWRDPKEAERRLVQLIGDKATKKVLITPTQAGKSISKEDWQPLFNELVKVGERKPTLVDVADERPAIRSLADIATDFDDLD